MKKLFTLFLFVSGFLSLNATHNRAGEILYKRIAPFTNVVGGVTVQVYTYSITVIKYTDDGPNVADRCIDTVHFGDGQKGVAPRINGLTSCGCGSLNGTPIGCGVLIVNTNGYKVKQSIYSIIHTYSGPGSYLIRSFDPNRNGGIHNIPNSINIPFFVEALLIINSYTGSNSSPVLLNPPTQHGIIGNCFYHNCCAYDEDGDSLSYEVTECRGMNGNAIPGYFFPETGPNGTFNINSVTGLLTWCAPQFIDEYNIAILIKEWRKNSCEREYELIGSVMRDMQIIVKSGSTNSFSSTTIFDTCVTAGTNVIKSMQINSPNSFINLSGGTETLTIAPAFISPTVTGSGSVSVTYNWQTNCSHVRKEPYDVDLVFSTTNGSSIEKFYRQFRVRVIPPSPTLQPATVDTGLVTLHWTSLSSCLSNLAGYNIYRKTSAITWTPAPCQQGVPFLSGYIYVGSAAAGATDFQDQIFWPILNGTTAQYIVSAYTKDCMESSGTNVQTLTLLVGIKENELLKSITIYPNPFNKNLEVDLGASSYDNLQTSVYSIDGKLVFDKEIKSAAGKLNLPLNELKSGIYTLTIKTEKGVFYKKIVKD